MLRKMSFAPPATARSLSWCTSWKSRVASAAATTNVGVTSMTSEGSPGGDGGADAGGGRGGGAPPRAQGGSGGDRSPRRQQSAPGGQGQVVVDPDELRA